ncbi:MAG: alpha-amylase family glycosyl hydrolase [Bacteroidales bacterium]
MKKIVLIISGLILFTQGIRAQLITCSPALPTDLDSVTITFDATQGNQGLKDYNGDIYAHTGVITNLSSSNSDWKYVIANWTTNIAKAKLTKIDANKYELKIGPSIRSFYAVPDGEIIKKLAFVFRNSTGSKEGKTATGGDIFYDVYEAGLAVSITSPQIQPYFVDASSTFNIHIESAMATSVVIKVDGIGVHTETTNQNSFDYTVNAEASGTHEIIVEATNGNETKTDNFIYVVRTVPLVENLPAGAKDGINYTDDNTVTLVLHAPYKNAVYAFGSFNDWQPVIMKKNLADVNNPELRYWITLTGLTPAQEYVFQYIVDDSIKIADPYTEKISDPWNDKYISSATYSNLIAYPEGKTDGIASTFQTAQVPYNWKIDNFTTPEAENLVIYELLMRDFTADANYQTMIDTLPYLKRLGINAIELMPVSEFEGNDSWGYNPSFYFAPDKAYGTKNKLKEFIDSCHQNGIAVIMDMVLNHSYGQSPLVKLYFNPKAGSYGQPTAQNLWYNQTSPNPTYSWGYDFNHESTYTKQFVDSVNSYWLKNYRIDGFRFDFTKGFTNTPGDGGAYDASRIAILKRMYDKIKLVNPEAYVILEHFADNSEEKVLSAYGMLIWGNMNYNFSEASMGYNETGKSDFSGASYVYRGWSEPHLVGYMESHDEERLMFKNKNYGNSSGNYNVKDQATALSRIELAATFLLLTPGPKMIWQFGELGYDYSINYNDDRVGKKPIKWEYYWDNDRFRLFQIYSFLINLKKENEVFKTSDFEYFVTNTTKRMNLNGNDMDVTVLGNFGVVAAQIVPEFQHTGTWYEYFSGNSIEVSNTSASINLQPGEYRIYSDVQLQKPEIIAGIDKILPAKNTIKINVYPNPSENYARIEFKTRQNIKEAEIAVYDISGKKICVLHKGNLPTGEQNYEWGLNDNRGQKVKSGSYIIKIQADESSGNSILLVK